MKYLLLLLIFFSTAYGFAQDSTYVDKGDAPIIVSKLYFGNSQQFQDIEVRFVEVLQDSRCPKKVTCVWEGEVIVLVDILKDGKKIEQKKLALRPTSRLKNLLGNLVSSETLSISGLNVLPYPVGGTKIDAEDYYIQLEVRN